MRRRRRIRVWGENDGTGVVWGKGEVEEENLENKTEREKICGFCSVLFNFIPFCLDILIFLSPNQFVMQFVTMNIYKQEIWMVHEHEIHLCQMDSVQPKDQFILNPNRIKLNKQEDCLIGGNVVSFPYVLTYSFHAAMWPIKENSHMVSGSTMSWKAIIKYWTVWLYVQD